MSPRKIRKVIKVKVDPAVSSNVRSNITRGPVQVHVNKPSKPASVAAIRRSNVQPNFKQPTVFKPITKIWNASDTVYIIGGGPSLKNFKWSELNNKKTIAINKALLSYPNADAVYWTDGRFYNWHKKDIDSFKGLKYTIAPRREMSEDIHLLKRGEKYGLSTSLNTLSHGMNSGYAAINLALHLGSKRIVLLGYDMGNVGSSSHYHDGYPINATSDTIYNKHFLPGFNILKEHIKGKGIEIFNACPTSRLDSFKKITIEESLSLR
jgi:hypothetical protein